MINIDPYSDLPAYEQIQRQITDQVRGGALAAGASLPTVRGLSAELGLAPNTVAKAYKALEQEGYLLTAGRRGTIVADQDDTSSRAGRRLTINYIAELRALGIGPGETMRLVRQVLAQ